MGCDWRTLDWWEYTARLWHWNEANPTDKQAGPVDTARLHKLMAVH